MAFGGCLGGGKNAVSGLFGVEMAVDELRFGCSYDACKRLNISFLYSFNALQGFDERVAGLWSDAFHVV